MKRRAVAEYQLAKNKQKLAEDVHAACLKYEAENRPALEAKIDSIHREFAADYDSKHKASPADHRGQVQATGRQDGGVRSPGRI